LGSFGSSGVSYANGDTFVLQPGIYLLHLSVDDFQWDTFSGQSRTNPVEIFVNANLFDSFVGSSVANTGGVGEATLQVAGDKLLRVDAPNTTVGFQAAQVLNLLGRLQNGCRIIFTRLQ
jgi:hypothetical protein